MKKKDIKYGLIVKIYDKGLDSLKENFNFDSIEQVRVISSDRDIFVNINIKYSLNGKVEYKSMSISPEYIYDPSLNTMDSILKFLDRLEDKYEGDN